MAGQWTTRRRGPAVVLFGAIVALLLAADARAGAGDNDAAELLRRFAPVLSLGRQTTPCGSGEPFYPVAVDAVLIETT